MAFCHKIHICVCIVIMRANFGFKIFIGFYRPTGGKLLPRWRVKKPMRDLNRFIGN